jgi:PAS domain S-box-containing protein
MSTASQTPEGLRRENDDLRQRLEEAEATIRAISGGEVDAFLVRQGAEDQVLVLDGVDRPYRLLIERIQQGAVTLTADGTIIYTNRCFAQMVVAPAADLLGTTLSEYVLAPDRPTLAQLLKQGLAADAECELSLRHGGDATLLALLTASPLVEREGILCLVVTDLTQQKRHELERERLAQEHSARVAAERASEALREADRRKDEFLAMLGHELRNPLAPIRNGLQVLNLIDATEPEAQQTRAMMGRQVDNLVRMVDDLLDVGRVTQGKIKLQKERTDLKAVLTRAVESCRGFVDEHGHRLVVTLPDEPLPVEADVIRVAQVVINLLNNAAKFTPRGGTVSLSAERDAGADQAVVRVRDSGVGIAPGMLPKVFDLFAQVDPTVARSEGGLGIGLTLARRLVEMHGGSLEAASAGLGHGSEFIVRLPLAPGSATADGARPAGEPATGRAHVPGRRILIVDDNRDSAESLAVLLRLLGHDVHLAYDGTQALQVAADFVPEMVLLDIGLPGTSGYEVARDLWSQAALRDVRVVALSGYGSADDRQRSLDAGFYEHLVKPVDIGVLESLLAAMSLDRRPTGR